MTLRRPVPALLLAFALAACGGGVTGGETISLDDELAAGANGQDPLLAAAVQDPIMTDPQLSTRSNADAIRPPAEPYAAPIPALDVVPGPASDDAAADKVPEATKDGCRQCAIARDAITLGALAARQSDPRMRACAPSLRYAAGWAGRLPADLPLHPSARVIEAGGVDAPTCRVRAVSFATRLPIDRVLGWYYAATTRAGYTVEHQADDTQHVLAGARARDGAAYVAFVREGTDGGSAVELLANTGR